MKADVVLYAFCRVVVPDVFGVDAVDCIREAIKIMPNPHPSITPIVDGHGYTVTFGSEYSEAMVTVPEYPDGMDFRRTGDSEDDMYAKWESVRNGHEDEE